MYSKKSELPRFQEFMLNEIFKLRGDAYELSLEERLKTAYIIISKNKSIYNNFIKNNFFRSFLMTSKVLVFQSDENKLIDIIDISYKVLRSKENIQKDYEQIINELSINDSLEKKTTMTHRKSI